MRLRIVRFLIWIISISSMLFAQEMMTIRLNGHDYQVENIFSKRIKEIYEMQKDTLLIIIENEIRSNQDDIDALNIFIPEDILINYYFDNSSNISYLEGVIDTILIKYNFKGHDDCWQEAKFGLKIKYQMDISFDTVSVLINLESQDPEVLNFHLNTHSPNWYEDWSDYMYCQGKK